MVTNRPVSGTGRGLGPRSLGSEGLVWHWSPSPPFRTPSSIQEDPRNPGPRTLYSPTSCLTRAYPTPPSHCLRKRSGTHSPRLPLTATSPAQSLLLGLLRPKRTGASATTALAEIHSGASAPHRPKACTPRNNKKAPGVDKAVRLAITGSRAVGTCDHVVTHAGYETDCGAQSVARQSVHVSRHDCILRRARRR